MGEHKLLKWFEYKHLPEHLQPISKIFHDAAHAFGDVAMPSAEATVAHRKLLEAKDAAVRAMIEQAIPSQ